MARAKAPPLTRPRSRSGNSAASGCAAPALPCALSGVCRAPAAALLAAPAAAQKKAHAPRAGVQFPELMHGRSTPAAFMLAPIACELPQGCITQYIKLAAADLSHDPIRSHNRPPSRFSTQSLRARAFWSCPNWHTSKTVGAIHAPELRELGF